MRQALQETLPRLPPRASDAHKGAFGTALIIGGARGMTGAAALAGMAALRGGAGLVRVAVADCCLESVAAFEPSYMTAPLPHDEAGRISAAAYDRIVELCEAATVIACGPGLGRSADLDRLIGRLYREVRKPMVVDADGLNALAARADALSQPGGPRILTPHPGEFARLTAVNGAGPVYQNGSQVASRQMDPPPLSPVDFASRCHAILVLKGHRTLVTDGCRSWQNMTGNPGMATGGSGDALTGLITALACQGLELYDAARLGVYLHGLAGDLAARDLGQTSLIASDLVAYLPKAFQELER